MIIIFTNSWSARTYHSNNWLLHACTSHIINNIYVLYDNIHSAQLPDYMYINVALWLIQSMVTSLKEYLVLLCGRDVRSPYFQEKGKLFSFEVGPFQLLFWHSPSICLKFFFFSPFFSFLTPKPFPSSHHFIPTNYKITEGKGATNCFSIHI